MIVEHHVDHEAMPETSDPLIQVRGLTKRYGATEVLRGVSFDIGEGEIFGLLGTNGAGKTTTVEILQGLRRRDGGTVTVLGLDPSTAGDRLRRLIGSQLQDAALPDRMRVGEAIELFSALHPTPRPRAELADEWQLQTLLRRSFGSLSGGERQRLFVALALVGRPRLVFLDELTQNLDPSGRRHTWEVIRQVRERGTTVVLVTHDVEEAERLCDRVAIVHHGRVVAAGTPTAIMNDARRCVVVSFGSLAADAVRFDDLPGVDRVERVGRETRVHGAATVVAHVGARLIAEGHAPADLRVERPSLEDSFLVLTEAVPA
jgi:ABC-2 type transport system ATP-binding protein